MHLLGCLLHQVELPLRHIICELDGNTNGPKYYKGPIGDAASHQTFHEQILVEFVPIYSEKELFVSSQVISDLSTDQQKLYEYCVGISKGSISKKFLAKKPGPIFHARWLTLALRIMMVYVRTDKPSPELLVITKYIVQVYCVMWFAIKRSGKYKDACQLLYKTIQLVKLQDSRIQSIILKNLQGNSYCHLQENFLYCMLLDENLNIRNQALNQILKIRVLKEDITFKPKLKPKSIMKINFYAESWDYLVSVDDIQIEPPTTLCIMSENLREAIKSNLKLCIIDMPNNSQSVERAVKLTSEASKHRLHHLGAPQR